MDLLTMVNAKRRELEEIFTEAGPAPDLTKVRRYGGDGWAALRDVRRLNDEYSSLVDTALATPHAKSLAALRAAFGARDEREGLDDYHRLRVEPAPRLAPIRGGW